jgi:hypothetical protein
MQKGDSAPRVVFASTNLDTTLMILSLVRTHITIRSLVITKLCVKVTEHREQRILGGRGFVLLYLRLGFSSPSKPIFVQIVTAHLIFVQAFI